MNEYVVTIFQAVLAAVCGVAGFTWKASEIRRSIEREFGGKQQEQTQQIITLREQIKYQQILIDKNNAVIEAEINKLKRQVRAIEMYLSKRTDLDKYDRG